MAHALTAVLTLVIALLTLMPQAPGPAGIPGFDKLAHFVAFAALAAPLAWRYPHFWRAVALATLAYGGLIEIVQPLTNRTAEWADLLADGAGAFTGAFAASLLGKGRFGGA
ncbi:MAG: VanZ family protein [Roseovarius sp.]|nr:VanZ family protein [Roseovarius sp.]